MQSFHIKAFSFSFYKKSRDIIKTISTLLIPANRTSKERSKMESTNTEEEELNRFNNICIDNDSSDSCKPRPPLPQKPSPNENYIDLENYIEKNCENKLKILDRSTFQQIQRPIIISFNHFREKCFYHIKWLDRLFQLSLMYGDRIDFIVADQIDLDVMCPHKNPMDYFCSLYRPEEEGLKTYAIDEKKRIKHVQHFESSKCSENLQLLCEKLLSGYLFVSQPIPQINDCFVKICVHRTYDELITNSTNDIFLIVGLTDYQLYEGRGPNYEQIAAELQDVNVVTVYINGLKNYIPFVFSAYRYPQLIFMPHKDKLNFIHYTGRISNTENVLNFVKGNIGSQGECLRQQKLSKLRYKPFTLPERSVIKYENLNEYISDNYPKSMKVLDRNTFHTIGTCIIIIFMDLRGKGVAFHVPTLQRVHQVAEAKYGYGVEYLIADLMDIDVIYPKWYEKNINSMEIDTHIFKIDRSKRKCKIENFKTVSSLVYHLYYFNYVSFFYTQTWPQRSKTDLVTTYVARNLEAVIKHSKKDLFLTIFSSTSTKSFKIVNILYEIVADVKKMHVKMIKMDAEQNYVPLEYSYSSYPVHFFIPRDNKDEGTVRYISSSQSAEDIFKFIREMVNISK